MQININEHKSIFKIIKEGFYLYLNNLGVYSKEMSFPIVAHLVGIPYILFITYYIPDFFPIETQADLKFTIVFAMIFFSIPGYILFLKGFWAYMVAIVSLNRYTMAIINNDKAMTPKACREYVSSHKGTYIQILFWMMLIWIIGMVLPFIVMFFNTLLPAWVILILFLGLNLTSFIILLCLSVYLSLSFQVFAFEDLKGIDIFKRSFELIENNFLRTALLLIVLFILTSMIFPLIICSVFEIVGINNLLAHSINWFSDNFIQSMFNYSIINPNPVTDILLKYFKTDQSYIDIFSKNIILFIINSVVTAGMLPLGSACFTLLYHDLKNKKTPKENTENV